MQRYEIIANFARMVEAKSIETLSVTFTAGVIAGTGLSGASPAFPCLLLVLLVLPLLFYRRLIQLPPAGSTAILAFTFLFLGMFAILCGAETYTGMQVFGELHLEELRQYLELPNGVPSHDVFGDVFSRVDIKAVEKCFQIFIESIKGENKDRVVALDGKTIRRSGNKEHKAAHIETAFLSDLELVLGQMATEEKSNELTAIPKLLEILALTNCTVTIDAMGTHRNIAEAIHDKGADYILPVKENQPLLLDDIKDFAPMNEVYATFFPSGVYPSRSAFEVGALPMGAKLEIEVIAVIK